MHEFATITPAAILDINQYEKVDEEPMQINSSTSKCSITYSNSVPPKATHVTCSPEKAEHTLVEVSQVESQPISESNTHEDEVGIATIPSYDTHMKDVTASSKSVRPEDNNTSSVNEEKEDKSVNALQLGHQDSDMRNECSQNDETTINPLEYPTNWSPAMKLPQNSCNDTNPVTTDNMNIRFKDANTVAGTSSTLNNEEVIPNEMNAVAAQENVQPVSNSKDNQIEGHASVSRKNVPRPLANSSKLINNTSSENEKFPYNSQENNTDYSSDDDYPLSTLLNDNEDTRKDTSERKCDNNTVE